MCGGGNRSIEVEDSGKALEMVTIKETPDGEKEYTLYRKMGEKWSYKGKHAREMLIVDRIKKKKRHIVEELNEKEEWFVVHDEEVPI
jgi:hypothetical protein